MVITRRMTKVCLRRLRQVRITNSNTFILTERDPDDVVLVDVDDIAAYLSSSYISYAGVTFTEALSSKCFDLVMNGLNESASTLAIEKLYFEEGRFSRSDFARITSMCKELMSMDELHFGQCIFKADPAECVADLKPFGILQRRMDEELLGLLRQPWASQSHHSISFVYAEVSVGFVKQITQALSNSVLRAGFDLSVLLAPQDVPESLDAIREAEFDEKHC
ncbi:hypothetical protein AAVH_27876, partial [Aphelenchoides avenae]